jgi:alpha-N-arabinofuranosidase
MAGNVFLDRAKPCGQEAAPITKPDFDPQIKLTETPDSFYLELALDKAWSTDQTRKLVTTDLLGRAAIPNLPFENADGSSIRMNTDYFGKKRNERNPFPGPFELPKGGKQRLKVWPPGSAASAQFTAFHNQRTVPK